MHFASKAIIFSNNKYLLQLRDNKKNILYPNHWALFGGRFKKNESAEECLINGYINYFYAQALNDIKSENLKEGQALHWFSKAEIHKLKIAKDLKIILDYLN